MYLVQFVMGAALAGQEQFGPAIEYLHRAIELQPDSTWAHYEMGSCLIKMNDYKTAVVHLEIASSRLPGFADIHSLLAQAYDHLGRSEEARRESSKAATLGGSKP
jgi:predicted Zn-dependent protease